MEHNTNMSVIIKYNSNLCLMGWAIIRFNVVFKLFYSRWFHVMPETLIPREPCGSQEIGKNRVCLKPGPGMGQKRRWAV